MDKDLFIKILAVFLILIGIYRFFQIIYFSQDFPRFFWLCNFAPLIFGVALFFRNSFVLIGEFCTIFFGQIFWTLDFLFYLLTKSFFIGSSAYIVNESVFSQIGSISIHLLVLPISFIGILFIGKTNKKAWFFSFILLAFLLPIEIYYGSKMNLNFFFYHNIGFLPQFPFNIILFPLAYIFLIVLPFNYFINFLIKKFKLTQ